MEIIAKFITVYVGHAVEIIAACIIGIALIKLLLQHIWHPHHQVYSLSK